MQATRIIAIRHGETDWNASTRIQGHTDIPLNAKGRQQAKHMAAALAAQGDIDAVYSSDLQRAWQTAQALHQALNLASSQGGAPQSIPLQGEPGLRERCFGSMEGLSFGEIEAQSPDLARQWKQRDPDYAPPQGETLRQFQARIVQTVGQLAARHCGGQIALVAHGGVLDILYRHANGLTLQAARSWTIENASINRFLWSPQALILVGWADNAHLEGTQAMDERIV